MWLIVRRIGLPLENQKTLRTDDTEGRQQSSDSLELVLGGAVRHLLHLNVRALTHSASWLAWCACMLHARSMNPADPTACTRARATLMHR